MSQTKSNIMLTLQESQWNHQRVTSRDPAFSNSSGAEPPLYSSLLCSNKNGGSTASSPHDPSSPPSYLVAIGRKDPSINRHSPILNGQKLQGSPNHTPRPSLASTTSPTPHAGPKSKFLDVKYRKTSQPPCSQESPRGRSRVNKPGKELKEHKKMKELLKRERKGEERKRHKKKEDKRLAERRKKRDKTAKKERKFGSKSEPAEKEIFSSCDPPEDTKMSKTSSLSPQYQGQFSTKHKHRIRRERVEGTHRSSTNTAPRLSKSANPKMPKKNSVLPKAALKEKPKRSPPRSTGPAPTKRTLSIVPSRSDDRLKTKSDDTLPSLLFKALAPLTAGCSVSLEQPVHGKDGRQGGLLNAPDLQPVAVMGSLQEMGDNLANTPPVLSWQGSPVSTLGDDEEELEKGVMIRPVLQPSPTQCFSPPPADSDSCEDVKEEPFEDTLDHSQDATSKLSQLLCATERVPEEDTEEDENSGEASGSPLHELHHRQTGLDDVLKSLTNFVEGQRATCRGGPFGGPAASNTRGVKYCSSLELGPDIHSCESLDLCPKPDPLAITKPNDQSPIHSTSDMLSKSLALTDLREHDADVLVQEKQEEIKKYMKEKPKGKDTKTLGERTESCPLDGSLSARLRLTTTHAAYLTSHVTVTTREEAENNEASKHMGTDRKRKQKAKDGVSEEEIKIKIRTVESRVLCPKIEVNQNGSLREKESAVNVISRSSAGPLKSSTKGHIPQENQSPQGKDTQRPNENAGKVEEKELKVKREDARESENRNSSAVGNAKPAVTISDSKLPASKAPCSGTLVDPLKLKALSMGLSKELKILLVKVKSGGRQTFNISEVEEQRIPLCKISITNTASEVVRACK